MPLARRPAAFQPCRRPILLCAAADEGAAQPAAQRAPRARREVTVDLATVSPGDEFAGSVVSAAVGRGWRPFPKEQPRVQSRTEFSCRGGAYPVTPHLSMRADRRGELWRVRELRRREGWAGPHLPALCEWLPAFMHILWLHGLSGLGQAWANGQLRHSRTHTHNSQSIVHACHPHAHARSCVTLRYALCNCTLLLCKGAFNNASLHTQNKFTKSITETVSVGDAVNVRVLSVDAASGKIALTMKTEGAGEAHGLHIGRQAAKLRHACVVGITLTMEKNAGGRMGRV